MSGNTKLICNNANSTQLDLKQLLTDPMSNSHVENILDVITALIWDCDFQSANNSKAIQSFVQRFSNFANVIYSQRIKYSDFETVKVIGQGGFGRVQLVRHKNTRRVYAMKIMSKQHLLDHSQSGYWEERDIMVKAASEWLVACHQSFVDKDNIYLCMEYMSGGDLYYWLEYYDTFTEEQARFYLAETVLALEALHNLGYIHRDLKPDNMLLDAKGHLKLADFGSCVHVNDKGLYYCTSPIGTPDYISPEMLNCQSKAGYVGPECDWWGLGVIAYEMLFGEPAFYGQSLVDTYSRILSHEKSLKFPADTIISADFENLVRSFLATANTRLGSRALFNGVSGAEAVKQHSFFTGIDWSTIHSSTPCIQPVVTSEVDTSNINFDESELTTSKFGSKNGTSIENGPSNLPKKNGAFAPKKNTLPAYFMGENLAFAGFTFNRDSQQQNNLRDNADFPKSPFEEEGEVLLAKDKAEAALVELKVALQEAEKQTAINAVSLKEVQDRLNDSNAERDVAIAARVELEEEMTHVHLLIDKMQLERENLCERNNEVQKQFLTTNEALDVERRNCTALRNEVASLSQLNKDLELEISNLHQETGDLNRQPGDGIEIDSQVLLKNGTSESSDSVELRSLKEKLEESRQQACRAVADLSSSRHLHAEELGDISDQLQASQYFTNLYKSQLAESEELLTQSQRKNEALVVEVSTIKKSLENAIAARRELKDKVFELESSLAVTQVELSGLKKNSDSAVKDARDQALRYKQLLINRSSEFDTLTVCKNDLLNHCKLLENNVATLTTQTQVYRKENEMIKDRLDQAVKKLVEVATNNPPNSAKKKKTSEAVKVCHLEKQLRNIEHTHSKEIIQLKTTMDNLRRDNSEKANTIAELTQANKQLEIDLQNAASLLNEYYESTDTKPVFNRASDNAAAEGDVTNNAKSSESESLDNVSIRSLSLESLSSLRRENYKILVEGICDFPVKARGRRKLAWSPKYIVISEFNVSFYGSKEQRMAPRAVPSEDIAIQKIFSIRACTPLDLNYSTDDDVSRLICIISDEIKGNEQLDSTLTSGRTSLSSNPSFLGANNSISNHFVVGTSHGSHEISWHGHSFQQMTFRYATTICGVCHRPCSDLLNPPLALECVRCRMRIHRSHVEKHENFVVCPKSVRQWFIRAPSASIRKEWISKIKQFQKDLTNISQNETLFASPTSLTFSSLRSPTCTISNSTRYLSMRQFSNVFHNSFKETPSRKSTITAAPFPRRSDYSPKTTPPKILPDSQHDL